MIELDNINYERSCGDCSMCCEGFLAADIHGYQMMQGVPCHFKAQSSKGCCSIYDNRPSVCVNYKCLYLLSPKQVPEWMKPNRSDVILGLNEYPKNEGEGVWNWVQMREGFNHVRGDVLNWVLRTCIEHDINLEYQVYGSWYYQGDDKWIDEHINRNGGVRVNNQVVTPEEVAQETTQT